MQTAEVGKELVALCVEGRFLEAVDRLYASEVVSQEPTATEGRPLRVQGKRAVRGKNAAWMAEHEILIARIEGPFLASGGDLFAVYFYFDVTHRRSGQRRQAAEIGLYTVADGVVICEQFLADSSRKPSTHGFPPS